MQWQAKWIWAKEHSETANCYIYARREIDLPAVSDAVLSIACCSEYRLFVNGQCVGRGDARSGPSFFMYDQYDVKRFLRPGCNVVGAICYNYGVDTLQVPCRPGGLLLQIDVPNSPEPILVSNNHWRVKLACDWDFDSMRMSSSIGFQEIYDSHAKPVGWNVVSFDDRLWEEPEVLGLPEAVPWGELILKQSPNLVEIEAGPKKVVSWGIVTSNDSDDINPATRMSRQTTEPKPGAIKYPQNLIHGAGEATIINPGAEVFVALDFGRKVVGFPKIRVRDGGHTVMDVGYCDELDEHGRVNPTRDGIAQADRLIVHGGRQEWQTFGRRAFRYMQLNFRNMESAVHIESVGVCKTGYPVKQAWSFECSDNRLNDIYMASANALSLCMQDSYERDPLQDPGSYPSDARVKALANFYSYVDFDLAASDIRRFARLQNSDGSLDIPARAGHRFNNPGQALGWALMLYDYYLYSGDRLIVEELYSNLSLLLDNYLTSRENEDGLLVNTAGAAIARWNAMYYQALRDASKLAVAAENFDDAQKWNARAVNVLREFNVRFWNEELSSYTATPGGEGSAAANVFAVAFGLAGMERCSLVKDQVRESALRLMPGFGLYVLQAMAKLDLVSEALETIIAARSIASAYFLPSEVLGVKASTPQSPVVVIQPKTGGLDWARGGYNLPTSLMEIEWSRADGKFSIDINAADGFIVALPAGEFRNPVIHEIDLTPETPERKARKTYGWGDVIWSRDKERVPYLDWLESQETEPPDHYQQKIRLDLQGEYVWVREPVSNHVRYVVHEDL
ncbi:MAG: family 78 glycoside hydrolase catalytic domain [Armatimonadetes bacterium]|nr:family 78 glycoside hydrolase catalytic domain [Armatimonadota bacterium]